MVKVPESCIAVDKQIELPGWFCAEKKWDLLIVHEGELLAASNSRVKSARHSATTSTIAPRKRSATPRTAA